MSIPWSQKIVESAGEKVGEEIPENVIYGEAGRAESLLWYHEEALLLCNFDRGTHFQVM